MIDGMNRRIHFLVFLLMVAGLLIIGLAISSTSSYAAPFVQQTTPTAVVPENQAGSTQDPLTISDEACLECHGKPGLEMTLDNGETWDLYVNPEDHTSSVHGESGYACVQCHRSVSSYPHAPFSAADSRDATFQLNTACQYCHTHQAELNQDGVHAKALEDGKREAAVCVDCHSAHSVQRIFDPQTGEILPETRLWIPQTCAKCHSAIYEKYHDSVHGAALTDEGNPDVPTCIDCHGVHNIADPTTAEFRLKSPDICAKCHTDPEIMNKYGISTEVLDTYVADFHGTTQVLFEQETPEQQFNKPVCYDCHGVHDIARTDDPQKGLLVRENLLVRCQVCHPDATVNFPDAWLSHYIPSPEKYPIVYYVDLFYKFLIPTVIGGMGLLVVLDFSKKLRDRLETQKRIPFLMAKPAGDETAESDPESTGKGKTGKGVDHSSTEADEEIAVDANLTDESDD